MALGAGVSGGTVRNELWKSSLNFCGQQYFRFPGDELLPLTLFKQRR